MRAQKKWRHNILKGRHGMHIRLTAMMTLLCMSAGYGHANGFGESSPWQFATASEQGVNLATTDLMERKRGGYFDGFSTIVYSTTVTNIGSQVNCNNVASAVGNEAANSQAGNAISKTLDGLVAADAVANSASTQQGTGNGTSSGTQTNDGTLNSSVNGSNVTLTAGASSNGSNLNDILNSQDNSGDQTAGVNSSTACDMAGATITGNSTGGNSGQILNAGE